MQTRLVKRADAHQSALQSKPNYPPTVLQLREQWRREREERIKEEMARNAAIREQWRLNG